MDRFPSHRPWAQAPASGFRNALEVAHEISGDLFAPLLILHLLGTAKHAVGTVGLQVVRDWVLRFNAKGPDGLIDGKATGKPAKLIKGPGALDIRGMGSQIRARLPASPGCSAYIFGAICPARGVGAGLVLPRCIGYRRPLIAGAVGER